LRIIEEVLYAKRVLLPPSGTEVRRFIPGAGHRELVLMPSFWKPTRRGRTNYNIKFGLIKGRRAIAI